MCVVRAGFSVQYWQITVATVATEALCGMAHLRLLELLHIYGRAGPSQILKP